MAIIPRYQIYVKWNEETKHENDYPWSAKTYSDKLAAELVVAEMNRYMIGKKNNYSFEVKEVRLYQKLT